MTRVYIAAPYAEIEDARTLAAILRGEGIACCSRWLLDGFEEVNAENATKDLEDVASCDALVAYNPPDFANRGTGGRHVEMGYALALGKPVVLVGAKSNIFHELDAVTVCATVEEATEAIQRLRIPA